MCHHRALEMDHKGLRERLVKVKDIGRRLTTASSKLSSSQRRLLSLAGSLSSMAESGRIPSLRLCEAAGASCAWTTAGIVVAEPIDAADANAHDSSRRSWRFQPAL